MSIVVRPGKHLVEKTRRQLVGVIARIGTGGSVTKPAQEALDAYVEALADGYTGEHKKMMLAGEKKTIRDSMKRYHGGWIVLSAGGGLRWVLPEGAFMWEAQEKAILKALKGSGWSPPKEQVNLLVWGNKGEGRRSGNKRA